MKVEVVMPKMGESINEGTLIKWHKQVGDKVSRDEIIFEIATDKVDTEIPSPAEGTLTEIKVKENETVEIDTVVAIIETNGNGVVSEKVEEKQDSEPVKEFAEEGKNNSETLIDIVMPKMGESVMEGTVVKWHKSVGDKVARDEIIFEIATDKVDTEVPSSAEGVLSEILVAENETVEVDTVVARISTSGKIKVKDKEESHRQDSGANSQDLAVSMKHEDSAEENKNSKSGITKGMGNKFYSPLVMNIARKEEVAFEELESIKGSGLKGRVTKKDILKYIDDRKKRVFSKADLNKEQVSKPAMPSSGVEVIPMDNIRQRILEHMVNSRDTSVHVTAITEVDLSMIDKFLKAYKDRIKKEQGIKLTYLSFIARATVKALQEYPLMNASIEGNNILQKKYVNLGIAVAVEPNGLIVPNIKNADEINTRGLSRAISDLSTRARTKKLTPDDISNGTFSITNYGVFGSLFGTPIINQPEVGILGVGAVQKKPVVITVDDVDTIAIKPMMYLSLSHDHRLVDGLLGGKFLKYIKDYLENFDTSKI